MVPQPEQQQSAVRIVGRYALYGPIAAGGMATVHFGRLLGPVGFSRTVAIKRLHPQFAADPEFVSMFLDEARLAARIRHPHVVPTLDVVATNGELFLVMDYVPGESLSRLIRTSRERGERIPVNITIAVMSGVLQGLHAAHEARNERGEPLGIVHRDVSPQNVLVGSDGQARVLDFGVAKAAGRVQTTREGQLKGKLAYMAPEQLRSETLTRKTDIYAAAVVLWESLTCERLFAGDNEGAVVTKVLTGDVPKPSARLLDVNRTLDTSVMRGFDRLDSVVMRGLDRDPAKRFDSAREMALALEKCFTPATAAEVSDWVERIAKPILLARAGQIAEIESVSSNVSRGGQIEAAVRAGGGAGWHAELGQPPGEVPTQTAISTSSANHQLPSQSQLSTISVSKNAALTQPSPRGRRVGIVVVAAFAMLAIPLAVVGLWRRADDASSYSASAGSGSSSAPPPAASTAASPIPPSSEPVVLPGPPPSAEPEPTPAVATEPQATTTAAHPSVAPPHPQTGGAPKTKSGAKPSGEPTTVEHAAPSTADGCNPPYTWDAEGRKHYKPNCL